MKREEARRLIREGRRKPVEVLLVFLLEIRRRATWLLWNFQPDGSPDRNQLSFVLAAARFATRLVFGGNQSGKSAIVAFDICLQLLDIHPSKKWRRALTCWVVAPVYENLVNGVHRHFMAMMPPWEIDAVGPWVDGHEGRMRAWYKLRNGSTIFFRAARGETGRMVSASAQVDLMVIDEEVEQAVALELFARMLAAKGSRLIVSATMKRSEKWVTELEARGDSGDPRVHLVRLSTKAALRAGHVGKEEYDRLRSSINEEEYDVIILGYSKRSVGLVYGRFSPTMSVAPRRRILPGGVDGGMKYCVYVGIDPGVTTCAVVWVAWFENGDVELFHEERLVATNCREATNRIFNASGWKKDLSNGGDVWVPTEDAYAISGFYIDPAARGRRMASETLDGEYEQFIQLGLTPLIAANNDLAYGIKAVRALMDHDPAVHRPRLVVHNHCSNWLAERAGYKVDPKTGRPKKGKDHFLDAFRYVVATCPGFTENVADIEPIVLTPRVENPDPFSPERLSTFDPDRTRSRGWSPTGGIW